MTFKLKNIIKPSVHFLTWCLLILFTFLITGKDERSNSFLLSRVWLPLVEVAIIFYLNYFFLIEKFLFVKRQYGVFIIVNVLVILFFRLDMHLFQLLDGWFFHSNFNARDTRNDGHDASRHPRPIPLIRSLLGLTMPTLLALVAKAREIWGKFELKEKEMENMSLKAELKNLKNQLQPHFFFNSLNNIYALVDLSPTRAQEAIHNLSKLMRYLLYETNRETIKLSAEINFLKEYIQLMELRHTDKTVTTYQFPVFTTDKYEIAPLLFIPLIENSYKHGVSVLHSSTISFKLIVKENKLTFTASNANYPKGQEDKSGSGFGLENLKKRLELIYPGRHEFRQEIQDNIFHVTLKIDL